MQKRQSPRAKRTPPRNPNRGHGHRAAAAVPPVQKPADDSKEAAQTSQSVGDQVASAAGSGKGASGGTGDARDELTFKSPLDIAELARGVAGAARFFADGAVGKAGLFDRDEAAIMADFVRANPDAPVAAMYIHLGLQKRYPRTEPNTADLFVLSLFHAACKAAIQFEADQAAEEAAKAPPAAPAGGWPGEQALQPSQPAFAPTGFTAR